MDSQVNQFLDKYLTEFKEYSFTDEDVKLIQRDPQDFIVKKLSLKKFRKRKIADKTRQSIKEKVKLSLDENRPFHFVVPFGGYKHFWNPSHPEPDWAELFNFKYLTDYVKPILKTHNPGAIIEYASEDLILSRMNNYPQKALDEYSKVFNELIEWYNTVTPNNLTFKYFRVGDKCNSSKIISKVEKLLSERRAAFDKLTQEEKDQELHRSKRAMLWKGEKDLSKLTDKEKDDRIIESRLVELAFYDTEGEEEFMGEYYWEDNRICIVFSFGTTHDNDPFEDLTLGSTYGSIVDHWIGRGILRERGNRFIPDIVSKKQYSELQDNITVIKVNDLLPHKSYSQIEVIKEG